MTWSGGQFQWHHIGFRGKIRTGCEQVLDEGSLLPAGVEAYHPRGICPVGEQVVPYVHCSGERPGGCPQRNPGYAWKLLNLTALVPLGAQLGLYPPEGLLVGPVWEHIAIGPPHKGVVGARWFESAPQV